MSFFLLEKGPDDRLRLLSPLMSDTRKDAMAELARVTADPAFSGWDGEVYVVDLEHATPVLLVRPTEAAAPPAETEAADEVAGEAVRVADEMTTESLVTEEAAVEVAEEGEAPDSEPAHADADEESGQAEEAQASDESSAESVADEALAAVVEGLDLDESADVEPVEEEIAAEGGDDSLREALERTAAHMKASGVTPPPSAGHAEAELDEETAAEDVEPSSDAGVTAGEQPGEQAGWPWASATQPADGKPAFSLDALEEPGVDEGSLVRAAGDDETMSASRPVILGAYDRVEVTTAPAETFVEPETVSPEPVDTEASSGEPESQVESDFILDLESIANAQADIPGGYQSTESDARQMTCNDCVYVETCPNKDQRDPATCGSFQWK